MTVNELIQQLQTYPGDMRVLALGYEGGFDDINLKTDDIVFNVNSEDTWYMGRHEAARFMDSLPNSDSQWKTNGLQGGECLIVMRAK
jgi:hypothetical protein